MLVCRVVPSPEPSVWTVTPKALQIKRETFGGKSSSLHELYLDCFDYEARDPV